MSVAKTKVTDMAKMRVYLRKGDLAGPGKAAAQRSGRGVAAIVGEAIREAVLKQEARGLAAIWNGEPKRPSIDHDSLHDDP